MQQSHTQTDQFQSARSGNANSDMAAGRGAQQTLQSPDNGTTQEPSKLLAATADANYKLTMEQAEGERDAAMMKCDGMTMDQQKTCRDRAAAAFATAQAQAENARNTRTPADSD